jgi:hypothetical protein
MSIEDIKKILDEELKWKHVPADDWGMSYATIIDGKDRAAERILELLKMRKKK